MAIAKSLAGGCGETPKGRPASPHALPSDFAAAGAAREASCEMRSPSRSRLCNRHKVAEHTCDEGKSCYNR
jgi:hypothetical protein